MKVNQGKCPQCGQEIIREIEIKQPTIVLASSKLGKDNTFTVLGFAGVGSPDACYQLGEEFRRWWDSHVVASFYNGFFGSQHK